MPNPIVKICFICSSFYPAFVYGGSIFSNYNLSLALAEIDLKLIVVTTNANGKKRLNVETNKLIQIQKHLYVRYYNETIIGRFSHQLLLNIWGEIKNANLVHLQDIFSLNSIFTLLYCYFLQKPVLITPRGVLSQWGLNAKRKYLKKVWLKSIVIIAKKVNASFHATSLQEKIDIKKIFPWAKIYVVPNGVSLKNFQQSNNISLNHLLSSKGFILENKFQRFIVSMGRIHKKKGFDILINSFKKLQTKNNDIALIIAGKDDGEKNRLEVLVKKLDLTHSVFFVGHIEGEEKMNLLTNADIFALTSHNENFGNVYAEALACGTPIIASTNTPWQEVEKQGCGKWVENNENEILSAFEFILKNDPEKMGQLGKSYIERIDWSIISLRMKEIYYRILHSQET